MAKNRIEFGERSGWWLAREFLRKQFVIRHSQQGTVNSSSRKFLSANSSAKVNCASPFWREINDTCSRSRPRPRPRHRPIRVLLLSEYAYAFAYDNGSGCGSGSGRSSVVCYASSKFSINIHKATNKSNQTPTVAVSSAASPRLASGRQLDYLVLLLLLLLRLWVLLLALLLSRGGGGSPDKQTQLRSKQQY